MALKHKYFSEDSPFRKKYFEDQFFFLASKRARQLGVPLSQYLSQITDINTFISVLLDASQIDPSLESYFSGMQPDDIEEFFGRRKIQQIVSEGEEVEIERIPVKIIQEEKRTRRFFTGSVRGKRVIAKKTSVVVKGKRQTRFRDKKGRFVKVN